jgi:dihydroxyacetone kinase DhaKLM complex PTS-EIIA-like component DhaM
MEPVTATIIAALVAGATAAAKDVATNAVKDAYSALKRLISDRYAKAGPFVDAVTAYPSSKPEQQVLAKQLENAGAAKDEDLKTGAQQLLDALQKLNQEPKAAALFDFGGLLKARNFELTDIEAIGPILRVKGDATFEGDFEASGIRQAADRSAGKN